MQFAGIYTYDYKADPSGTEHIVDEVVLMEAPIITDFANLESLQIVIVVHECVHVGVQALQVVDTRRVKLNFNKVFRVGYKQ